MFAAAIVVCCVMFAGQTSINPRFALLNQAIAAIFLLLSIIPILVDLAKDFRAGKINLLSALFVVGLIAAAAAVYFLPQRWS